MIVFGRTLISGASHVLIQATDGIQPLPADPPIGGAVWTVVIPAILFVGSFMGTYLLYKRFSREEDAEG